MLTRSRTPALFSLLRLGSSLAVSSLLGLLAAPGREGADDSINHIPEALTEIQSTGLALFGDGNLASALSQLGNLGQASYLCLLGHSFLTCKKAIPW